MTLQAVYLVWWVSIVLLLVVTVVVALLLTLVLRTARSIQHTVADIWTEGKMVANNTIHIPLLVDTNRIAGKILDTAGKILAGADAIMFGGGIGENAPEIRERICRDMEWCGLRPDPERNAAAVGLKDGDIVRLSPDGSGMAAYVVAVDEETEIARETVRCLKA